jgi:Spy/CpxP family protein refolding chaperone
VKEKDEQLGKLKNRHQAEIKKIEYQHQVKFSQLSKTDRNKLKKLEEADVIDTALNEAKALQEEEQRKKFLEQEAIKKYKKNPKVEQSAQILNEKEDPQIDMEFHKMIE